MENIILIDKNDNPIGQAEKLVAHEKNPLHRAFSIFIFNDSGKLMLQKRKRTKYHSGGLWTNTCCSHPRVGENTKKATHRRLVEEMGFDCELEKKFNFIYKTELEKGLSENEFDHVFVGKYNDEPKLNPEEAEDWKWIGLEELKKDIKKNPNKYTFWLKEIIEKHNDKLK